MLRLVLVLVTLLLSAPAMAQDPFAPAPSTAPAQQSEPKQELSWSAQIVQYVQTWQAKLYRDVAATLRALKDKGALGPLLALLGIAFMYGVLHAAGPGHGKAVIAAYLAADNSAFARGIALSFLSSAAQAITAIAGVGILAWIIGMVARDVSAVAFTLERISYVMIAGVGAYLIWRATRDWFGFAGHGHARRHAGHSYDHDHIHGPECAHDDHLVLPPTRPVLGNLRETAAIVFSIGIRPCQGSVFILLLATAFGVFWAGVLAALAVALGTALTVSAIAVLTVAARQTAGRMLTYRPAWLETGGRVIAILAGLFILWIGLALAAAPPPPLMPGLG